VTASGSARAGGALDRAMALMGALTLDDGRRWGDTAESWQLADARAVLDPDSATPYHFQTRPRGGAKTSDAAGVGMSLLLAQAPTGARLYCVASDADQAGLVLDSVRGQILRAPSLAEHLRLESRKLTALKTGATLEVVPADEPSAYGKRPWLLIADELAQWPSTRSARGMWTAMVSALPKIRGARLLVLTSAGDPSHWSHKILKQARKSPRWRTSEIGGPLPWVEPEALEEQQALLTESQFARLHLNVWTAAEDRLVRPDDLAACVVLDGPLDWQSGPTYVVGVDVGLRHDRTVVAVCHDEPVVDLATGRPAQRVVLDRMHVLAGSREREVSLETVETLVLEAHRSYGRARVRIDPWQAIGLAQRLRARGVTVEEYPYTATSVGRLASTLHLLLRDRLLALPDDEELIAELSRVRLRESSVGVLRLDHDDGEHDDRAQALALAALALVERGAPGRGSLANPATRRMAATPITRAGPGTAGAIRVGRRRIPAHLAGFYKAPERQGPFSR